jgi:hypothetical protein
MQDQQAPTEMTPGRLRSGTLAFAAWKETVKQMTIAFYWSRFVSDAAQTRPRSFNCDGISHAYPIGVCGLSSKPEALHVRGSLHKIRTHLPSDWWQHHRQCCFPIRESSFLDPSCI